MPVATTRETQVEGDYIHISKEPASDDDQRDDVDVESFVQLVNEKGEFTTQLQGYLQRMGMIDKGWDYSIIAVFGPQSSGKSTLLNRLFNTEFPTMDSSRGRYQVTRGVVCSKADEGDIIVLDVEGTDSKEGGEENLSFERKISLFTLAISEVLLVNMWLQDIGRYNASNYALLKIVFELNLQLFLSNHGSDHEHPKTLLLFVIRDHIEQVSSLKVLREMIQNDVKKIWDGLTKPEGLVDSNVLDFFDIDFVSLPHKQLQAEEFERRCLELKTRFYDDQSKDFVFLKERKKNVPIDGFEHYASNIWSVISQNKDLDIPTQKEMVAMVRCKEISGEVQGPFSEALHDWNTLLSQDTLVENLGASAKMVVDEVIKVFQQKTAFYVPKVVDVERFELENKLKDRFKSVYSKQITLAKKQAQHRFKSAMSDLLKDPKKVLLNFTETVDVVRQESLHALKNALDAACYPGEIWDLQLELEKEFTEEVDRVIANARKSQIDLLLEQHTKKRDKETHSDITSLLIAPNTKTLWSDVRQSVERIRSRAESELNRDLKSFSANKDEAQHLLEKVIAVIHEAVKSRVRDAAEVSMLQLKMQKVFDETFRYTEDRLPRTWRRMEDVKEAYSTARSAALQLLDAFFLLRLDESLDDVHLTFPSSVIETNGVQQQQQQRLVQSSFKFPSSEKLGNEDNILLDEQNCLRCFENFSLKAEIAFAEAQRQQLMQSAQVRVPWWLIVLIIVLGWNEFMYFLTQPMWILLFIVVGALFAWNFLQNRLEDYLRDGNPQIVLVLRLLLQYLPMDIFPSVQRALRQQDRRPDARDQPVPDTSLSNTNTTSAATASTSSAVSMTQRRTKTTSSDNGNDE